VRKQAILLGVSLVVPLLVLFTGFKYISGLCGIGGYMLFILYTLLNRNSSKNDQKINIEEGIEEMITEPVWKGILYLTIGGAIIYIFSEPFINSVVKIGLHIQINPIALAFFFAPIASEAPEIFESISLSRKGKTQNINISFSNLICGTISKTTLLMGILCLYGVNKQYEWVSPAYTVSLSLIIICAGVASIFGFEEEHTYYKGIFLIFLFIFFWK